MRLADGSRLVKLALPLALVFAALAAWPPSAPASGGPFTVTNTSNAGPGSLRQAIEEANAAHCCVIAIDFSIGSGQTTISLSSALPPITGTAVSIDATTQPGYSSTPLIRLDGVGAPAGSTGLLLEGGEDSLRGLQITNWSTGIRITKPGSGALLEANYIGNDGTSALPNTTGVEIDSGASFATIGGPNGATSRNVISGNGVGVRIAGSSTKGNDVEGNFIGTDATGNSAISNNDGVIVKEGAEENTVGGAGLSERNVCSGNSHKCVGIFGVGTKKNRVEGNLIGTDVNGSAALGNRANDVQIGEGATENTIGGSGRARQVIAASLLDGVVITGSGTDENQVVGNYIGTDESGSHALGNGEDGVLVGPRPEKNAIGGASATMLNVISGNSRHGVEIRGTENRVNGNYIGLDASGGTALGNHKDGVVIMGKKNTVGGPSATPGASPGNVISGNLIDGVRITGISTSSNVLEGNCIGTESSCSAARANGRDGVLVDQGASGDAVGGATPAGTCKSACNVIADNSATGIVVAGKATVGNAILGNSIFANGAGAMGPGIALVSGANASSPAPTISPSSTTAEVKGVATPGSRVEVFSNPISSGCTDPEGRTFLGSTTAAVSGSWSLTVTLAHGESVTATATEMPSRNTSPFSGCLKV
jgi:titin